MNFNLLFLCLTLLFSTVFVFFLRKTKTINVVMTLKSHLLILCILLGITLNFAVAYFVGDPTESMAKMFRPSVDKFSWDMGATVFGWILYEIQSHHSGADSWWYMAQAIDFINSHPIAPLYQEVFFNQQIKFQYPTTSLIFLDFLKSNSVLEWKTLYDVLNYLSMLTLPFLAWNCYKLYYRGSASELVIDQFNDIQKFWPVLLCILAVLLFYPITFSLYLGQIQTMIVLIVAASFLTFSQKKFIATGILLGLCAVIKPQWALIFLWAAFRRQWQLLLAGMATIVLCSTIAIYLYGGNNFLDYQSVLKYLSVHGESYYLNQSVNGLVNRMLMNGINTEFVPWSFPPYHPAVYIATLVSSVLIIGFILFWRIKETPNLVDLAVVVLGLTLASPIAWNHHYGILLPIFALSFPIALKYQVFGSRTMLYLLTMWALTSQNFEGITNQLSATHWNFLQSIFLVGVLMAFYMLIRIAKHVES